MSVERLRLRRRVTDAFERGALTDLDAGERIEVVARSAEIYDEHLDRGVVEDRSGRHREAIDHSTAATVDWLGSIDRFVENVYGTTRYLDQPFPHADVRASTVRGPRGPVVAVLPRKRPRGPGAVRPRAVSPRRVPVRRRPEFQGGVVVRRGDLRRESRVCVRGGPRRPRPGHGGVRRRAAVGRPVVETGGPRLPGHRSHATRRVRLRRGNRGDQGYPAGLGPTESDPDGERVQRVGNPRPDHRPPAGRLRADPCVGRLRPGRRLHVDERAVRRRGRLRRGPPRPPPRQGPTRTRRGLRRPVRGGPSPTRST